MATVKNSLVVSQKGKQNHPMTSDFAIRVYKEVIFSHKKKKKKTLYINFHSIIIHNTEKVGKNPNWWVTLENVV